jgi:hypothetical protein
MSHRSIRARSIPFAVLFAAVLLLPAMPSRAQNGAWSAITGLPATPGPRREFGAIFDRDNQRYLLFSGFNGNTSGLYILFNDVWMLSVSGAPAWSHVDIAGALPGERHSPQWGYDAARNRVLIFGGYGKHYPTSPSYEYLNDVWELSLDGTPHWTELHPAGITPSGRLAGAAVFDPMRQRFVGFGGTIGVPVDTWVLNLQGEANWQPLPIDGPRPNGGWGMTSVYDAKRDRMLIFGGSISDEYWGARNEVWELDLRGLPVWKQVTTTGTAPKPRRSGTAVLDPIRDRMVIYGGFDAATPGTAAFLADTWALDLGGSNAWTQLSPSGTVPVGRDAVSAAYDPIHDRMVMFGGWSGDYMLGDTQFLDWGGSSLEASLTPSASATPDAAHVEWDVAAATGNYAAVYRRAPGGDWSALAEGEVGANGKLVYDDATVQAGSDYSYMMVVGSQRGETFGGEALVHVPNTLGVNDGARTDFALAGVSPNPAIDQMSVSFVLASAEAATLDLIDVSGRRLLGRDVGALGAGSHRIDLVTAGLVPPGMYFLRLRQGARVASSRIVIAAPR